MRALLTGGAFIAALAVLSSAPVQAQPPKPAQTAPGNQCFQNTEFRSWRAPDSSTIYVRVRVNDIYELKLTGSCPHITAGDARLITEFRGSSSICNATDWDLRVAPAGPGSLPVPCIVNSMRRLTPAVAAAIPKRYRP